MATTDGKKDLTKKKLVLQSQAPAWAKTFYQEFEKESDRAAVILSCAMIDDALRDLLEASLIPCSSSDDPLFDGSNAPLSTFNARIESAYRFGLISKTFARCLHITRKIRNSFAHDITGCKFQSHSVISRIEALKNATKIKPASQKFVNFNDPREMFCCLNAFFIWQLKKRTRESKTVCDDLAICCEFIN